MQSDLNDILPVTQELVDFLDTRWPLELFNDVKSLEDLHLQKGRREVITFLKLILASQKNRIF